MSAGRVEEAFAHYSKANTLRLKNEPYDPVKLTRTVDRSVDLFTAESFAERPGGSDVSDPIFIVGLPRAGSTLIEQILSSHSLVEGTAELPDIPAMIRRIGTYPDAVLRLGRSERVKFGQEYLKRAGVQRRTQRPYFIDKLPEQLAVRAVHPSDAAERKDHRCAPASARLLLLQFQAAFRPRSEFHLRS